MILPIAFFLLQTAQAQPPRPQADELRIVAVEQTGIPPYSPEGRVYRLAGNAASRISPGEILIIKRPKEPRRLGLLRVTSVHPDSVAASLEVKGETFPLKGDQVLPLASLEIPSFPSGVRDNLYPLKDIPFPLNPFWVPGITHNDLDDYFKVSKTIPWPQTPNSLEAIIALSEAEKALAAQVAEATAQAAQAAEAAARAEAEAEARTAAEAVARAASGLAVRPKHVAQNPFYFLEGNSELSPRGLEKLREWVQAWGRSGVVWFLAVPQTKLMFEELLVERLTALQNELHRLGVANVHFRADAANIDEPYDVIYVGVER